MAVQPIRNGFAKDGFICTGMSSPCELLTVLPNKQTMWQYFNYYSVYWCRYRRVCSEQRRLQWSCSVQQHWR